MSKFPKCEELGLHVFKIPNPDADLVSANDLEKLLSAAPVVYGRHENGVFHVPDPVLGRKSRAGNPDTHSALLIGIKPIVKDSAEQILKDLVETADSNQKHNLTMNVGYFVDRAKKLLEGK